MLLLGTFFVESKSNNTADVQNLLSAFLLMVKVNKYLTMSCDSKI
jgi:hypothetical protein